MEIYESKRLAYDMIASVLNSAIGNRPCLPQFVLLYTGLQQGTRCYCFLINILWMVVMWS